MNLLFPRLFFTSLWFSLNRYPKTSTAEYSKANTGLFQITKNPLQGLAFLAYQGKLARD